MDPLKRTHRRLQNKAEREGEHDRQDDLGGDITGGKHRDEKEAAEKYCIDIRWDGQIVFVGARTVRWRVRSRGSRVASPKQVEFCYCH